MQVFLLLTINHWCVKLLRTRREMPKLELTLKTPTIDIVATNNLADHKQVPHVVARTLSIVIQLLSNQGCVQVRIAQVIQDSKATEQMVHLKIIMIR